MKTQKLTVFEKVGFGAGDMAVNVVISSMFLIITFFYTDVFGLKPIDMGIMFMVVELHPAGVAQANPPGRNWFSSTEGRWGD